MASNGAQSAQALATPVTRLVAPGPEAAMHTPSVFLTRPNAWAIIAAACSWRTSMPRSPSSIAADSAAIIGPPMM